jgi:hypothetical protein
MSQITDIREIDFEEDDWRHDHQYIIKEKCQLLVDMTEFLLEKEEILPHYILQLRNHQLIVYTLLEEVFLNRGLLVDLRGKPKVIEEFKEPPAPEQRPRESQENLQPNKLLRPGVGQRWKNGRLN